MADPFRLRVLKALSAELKNITPTIRAMTRAALILALGAALAARGGYDRPRLLLCAHDGGPTWQPRAPNSPISRMKGRSPWQ